MRKLVLFFVYSFFVVASLFAVKAYSGLLSYTQPDGSIVNYYLCGDENFNYMLSEDGALLTFDNLDYLVSAELSTNGVIQPSLKRTRFETVAKDLESIMKRRVDKVYSPQYRASSNKGYPLTGSPKSLVILVNFSDVEFKSSTANQDFFRLLNEVGYSDNDGRGSARDYFRNASNGVFEPEFVVVGPYTLPKERKYYGEKSGANVDKRPANMIVDACAAADTDIDFNDFDENGDGYVDNVFVYYAGHNQAEGGGVNTIWPHRAYISADVKYDGVRLGDYACTSELKSSSGNFMCGIGTFVHEFGHVLSLPDLYDTEYSGHNTLGSWDVMDNGSYNNSGRMPPTYSAYERFYLGWLQPKQLSDDMFTELEPISVSNSAYLVAATQHNMNGMSPDPKEFFLIENRSQLNNDGVPAEGLLITRIVYGVNKWNSNTVNNNSHAMGVEICCAAGNTTQPMKNVFPGNAKVTNYQFELRNGTILDKGLSKIVKTGDIVSFVYGSVENIPSLSFAGDDLQTFDIPVGEEQIKQLNIKGFGVAGDVHLLLKSDNYSIRQANTNNDFVDKLTFAVGLDSTLDVVVDIKYAPKEYTYSNYVSESMLLTTVDYEKPITLRGCAPRPIYVTPPVARDAENVSPYTFVAVWDSVFDATEYLLSVYTISGVDTNFVCIDKVVSAEKSNQIKCEVGDLFGDTEYKYRVKASDKDLYGRYENVTDYSNEISVTTLSGFGIESRKLDVLKDGDRYMIYLPVVDENHSIFIYSMDGRLIASVPVLSNVVEVPQLASNKVYVLKYASNDGIKRKSKVIKLYYE